MVYWAAIYFVGNAVVVVVFIRAIQFSIIVGIGAIPSEHGSFWWRAIGRDTRADGAGIVLRLIVNAIQTIVIVVIRIARVTLGVTVRI